MGSMNAVTSAVCNLGTVCQWVTIQPIFIDCIRVQKDECGEFYLLAVLCCGEAGMVGFWWRAFARGSSSVRTMSALSQYISGRSSHEIYCEVFTIHVVFDRLFEGASQLRRQT